MKVLKVIGILLVGVILSVVCAVLYPTSWLLRRIVGIPYNIFKFIEGSTFVFFSSMSAAYKAARDSKEKEVKTLLSVTR